MPPIGFGSSLAGWAAAWRCAVSARNNTPNLLAQTPARQPPPRAPALPGPVDMDDIYEPVYDSAALEDHLLPEPVETFLLVALCWCLVAWLLRLCYMAMHLLDLRSAIEHQRLSAHDSVPLHSEVVNLDPQTKTRFLSFLRARTPPTPTAAVPCYSVPLSLNGARRRGQKRRLLPGAPDRPRPCVLGPPHIATTGRASPAVQASKLAAPPAHTPCCCSACRRRCTWRRANRTASRSVSP